MQRPPFSFCSQFYYLFQLHGSESLSLARLFQNHLLCNRIISRNDFLCPITESAYFAGAQRSEPRRKNVGLSWPFVCDLWFIVANTHTLAKRRNAIELAWSFSCSRSLFCNLSYGSMCVYVCKCVSPELESLFSGTFFLLLWFLVPST